MKILTLICGEPVLDEILVLFATQKVEAYTIISGVGGKGATEEVPETGPTNINTMYLIALDDAPMVSLVNAVKELHAKLVEEHMGRQVPLKVLLQPCEVVV